MKIITEEEVYVQFKDLDSLIRQNIVLPKYVFKCFNNVKKYNRNDFLRFEDPIDIEFFRNIDWICDYNELKNYSLDELLELEQKTLKSGVMKNINDDEETKKRVDIINDRIIQKYTCITDVYKIKTFQSDFELPSEYKSKNKVSQLVKNILNRRIG